MTHEADLAQIQLNRVNYYRWLSRLYRAEIDQPLLDRLKEMRFPASGANDDLKAGYSQLRASLDEADSRDLDVLAADYAKVFLGAGIARGSEAAAFPFASVYTSPKRIMMQEARDRAVETFANHGLRIALDKNGLPEDHLANLLEFMAWLCQSCHDAVAAADNGRAANLLSEQLSFLRQHLLNWVPKFCADLEKHAETLFYQSIGKITRGFLQLDGLSLAVLASPANFGGSKHGLCSELL